jgi:hypothetical protein
MKGISMKKEKKCDSARKEMRDEYDFSAARPNKYAKKYSEGANLVVIEPDLVKWFPDSESVNSALRALVSAFPQAKLK